MYYGCGWYGLPLLLTLRWDLLTNLGNFNVKVVMHLVPCCFLLHAKEALSREEALVFPLTFMNVEIMP